MGSKFHVDKINNCTYKIRNLDQDVTNEWPVIKQINKRKNPEKSPTLSDNKNIKSRLNRIVVRHKELQDVLVILKQQNLSQKTPKEKEQ